MTCSRPLAIVAFGLSAVIAASADQGPAPGVAGAGAAGRSGARIAVTQPSAQAHVTGLVVTMHEPPRPVPRSRVRLRSTLGKIIETTRTNEKGEFSFTLDEGGSFYAELVDDKGRVLAVEDMAATTVSVTLGQASTTIIRVPIALADSAWSSAARTILGAAAASGVAGVAATGQPLSPER